MKRLVLASMLLVLALQGAAPALARVRVINGKPRRTAVIVRRGFPIRRAIPICVVRPARTVVVVRTTMYLAPVIWTERRASLPPRDQLVWEDSEKLSRNDDWTEVTFNVNDRGTKLFLQIDGKAQIEFAEVVYVNGEAQTVDFEEHAHDAGIYSLLDFPDGRKVSHVRMVARAQTDEARLSLRMEK
jgi:hypothetical protein